jgi:phospholipid transport system substrate-binding protein
MSMKPELSSAVPPRRWNAALVILVAAVSFGAQPALSGDAVPDVQLSAITGRARPLDLVKSSVSKVLAVVQSRPAAGHESGQRRAEIRQVADGFFDFNEMARLSLSQLSTIENYAGERITFLGESINGAYAQVWSRITTDRRVEISIDYRLIDSGYRWAVYDVVLDGMSLVSNYRSQFNSIVRTSSFEELLARLRNRQIEAHVIPRVGRAP